MGLLHPAQGSPTPEGGSARPEMKQKKLISISKIFYFFI